MKYPIHVYNIKYKGKQTILSVTGPEALQNFVDGYTNVYDASTAPKTADLIIDIDYDPYENFAQLDADIKKELHKDVVLEVMHFDYLIYNPYAAQDAY